MMSSSAEFGDVRSPHDHDDNNNDQKKKKHNKKEEKKEIMRKRGIITIDTDFIDNQRCLKRKV